MKRSLALAAATMLASGLAYAGHCPKDVVAIDAAMKTAKLSDADKKEVQALRDKGDAAHKAGKHGEALESLHKAMDKLGIKHEDKK